jgi:putative DNA primase/helicase
MNWATTPDAFARQLKDATRHSYGVPLRGFLNFVAQNRAETEKAVRNFQADFLNKHVPTGASGEVYRAAQRYALIAAAGQLATDTGITGWGAGESFWATAQCFKNWLERRGTVGAVDMEVAIRQVKRFVEVNGASRFQPAKSRTDGNGEPIPREGSQSCGFPHR